MIKQRSKEGFEQRKGRVTGSRAGAILGLSPYQTPDDVLRAMVREYHGAESEFTGNVAKDYGTVNEDNVQWAYEIETGNTVEECGFFPYEDWLGASPDGIVNDDLVVEFKAPYGLRNGGKFKTLTEQPHYYAQGQLEMLCTGKWWCAFVQWSPKMPLDIEHVQFDKPWLDENLPKLKAFHARYLSELDNPDHLAPKRVELTAIRAVQLAEEYDDLRDAIDRSKERQKDILKELSEISKGKNAIVGDYKLTKVERKGNVSYAKVVKDHCPDVKLDDYRGKPSEYWMLK